MAEEVNRMMRREGRDPLHIREKLFSPWGLINNLLMIENDANLTNKYLNTQAQAFAHFDDISRLL